METRRGLLGWPESNPIAVRRILRILGMVVGINLVYWSYLLPSGEYLLITLGVLVGVRNSTLVLEKAPEARPTLSEVLYRERRGMFRVLVAYALLAGIVWVVIVRGPDRWYGLMAAASATVIYALYRFQRGLNDDEPVAALALGIGLVVGGAVAASDARGVGWAAALTCLVAGCVLLLLLALTVWFERHARILFASPAR